MNKPIKLNRNGQPRKQGSGRPKGATSLRQILLKDLVAQLPQSAVVTVGAVWSRNLGIKFSDEDLSNSVMVQSPQKVEAEKEEVAPIQLSEVNLDDL